MQLKQNDYAVLAEFRRELRRFLAVSEEVAQATGLPPGQYHALLAIKGRRARRKVTIGGLAKELMIAHHSATELVDRLESRGLLTRSADPCDRRRILLNLTAEAESLLESMAQTHLEELRRLPPALLGLASRFAQSEVPSSAKR